MKHTVTLPSWTVINDIDYTVYSNGARLELHGIINSSRCLTVLGAQRLMRAESRNKDVFVTRVRHAVYDA